MSSTDSITNEKPAKPYPEFPLYAHASGRWAKKIRGKTHFFGKWGDPQAALRRYYQEIDDLRAGRIPARHRAAGDLLTVDQMVNHCLAGKKLKVLSGELVKRTWKEYESYGDRLVRVFGKTTPVVDLGPSDFRRLRADLQKTHNSLVSIRGDIRKTKVFFNWALGEGYIERLPNFGDAFRAPPRAALEREREALGERCFTADQIRAVLAVAHTNLKAMVLLGVNCGYGNMDCCKLPIHKLDLGGGWPNFPRTKNAIRRRCPLWPETIEALRQVLATRKTPQDPRHARRLFVTQKSRGYKARNLSRELGNALERAGLSRDTGVFYDLRRTCASIGIQVKDDDAVRTIMGHKRPGGDMLGVYNQLQVDDDRLRTVTEHIHGWLFPP